MEAGVLKEQGAGLMDEKGLKQAAKADPLLEPRSQRGRSSRLTVWSPLVCELMLPLPSKPGKKGLSNCRPGVSNFRNVLGPLRVFPIAL